MLTEQEILEEINSARQDQLTKLILDRDLKVQRRALSKVQHKVLYSVLDKVYKAFEESLADSLTEDSNYILFTKNFGSFGNPELVLQIFLNNQYLRVNEIFSYTNYSKIQYKELIRYLTEQKLIEYTGLGYRRTVQGERYFMQLLKDWKVF